MFILQDITCAEAEFENAQKTMAIYVIRVYGANPGDKMYADVGVLLKGVEVLQKLQWVTLGCVMLFGLIYALKLP